MDLELRVSALESMVNLLAEKNSTLQDRVSALEGMVISAEQFEASKVNTINLKEEQ